MSVMYDYMRRQAIKELELWLAWRRQVDRQSKAERIQQKWYELKKQPLLPVHDSGSVSFDRYAHMRIPDTGDAPGNPVCDCASYTVSLQQLTEFLVDTAHLPSKQQVAQKMLDRFTIRWKP
jgi:hypothetical protein